MSGNTVIAILVASCIPLLASRYLGRDTALRRLKWLAILFGWAWFGFAFYHAELATTVLGLGTQDAEFHERNGMDIADAIRQGDVSYLLDRCKIGNRTYHIYLGVLFLLTGCDGLGAVMLNMLVTYWAGLCLTACMVRSTATSRIPRFVLMLGIFVPSLVYWATNNMKEGWMYWACVQIFCSIASTSKLRSRGGNRSLIAGLLVAAALRPPVAAVWIGSVIVVNLFRSGRLGAALFSLSLTPLLLTAIGSNLGSEVSLSSTQEALEDSYVEISSTGRGSVITYYGGKPTFFISGAISLFFRPFFWEARSAPQMMAAAETWLLSALIFIAWMRLSAAQRKQMLHQPLVQASLIALTMFCVLFTWIGNEGLLHRQKTQALPGLLVLIALPTCARLKTNRTPSRNNVAVVRRPLQRTVQTGQSVIRPPKRPIPGRQSAAREHAGLDRSVDSSQSAA